MLFSKNMSLLLLKNYEVVAVFKCLSTLKVRELVFAVLVRLVDVFVPASKIYPVNSNTHFRRFNRHKIFHRNRVVIQDVT